MDFREKAIKIIEKANLCYRTKEYKISGDELKFTQAFIERVFNLDSEIRVRAERNSQGYLVFFTNRGYIGRIKLRGRVTKMQLLNVEIPEANEYGVAFVNRDRVEEYIALLNNWLKTVKRCHNYKKLKREEKAKKVEISQSKLTKNTNADNITEDENSFGYI